MSDTLNQAELPKLPEFGIDVYRIKGFTQRQMYDYAQQAIAANRDQLAAGAPQNLQPLATVQYWAREFAKDPQRLAGGMIVRLLQEYADLRAQLAQQGQGKVVAWGNFKEDGTCVGLSQHPEDIARWQNPKPLCIAAPASAQPTEAALRKLCDQLDGMKRRIRHTPGTGQNHSYLLHEDVEAYVEEARKALAAPQPAARVAVPDGFVWPEPPPSKGQSHVLFEDGYAEGWAKCIDTLRAMLAASPATLTAPAQPACTLPPEGWSCTRGSGHQGPCAASPVCPTCGCSPCGCIDRATVTEPAAPTEKSDIETLREQSDAWFAVADVLHEVSPRWQSNGRTGLDAAVATIRSLAAPAAQQAAPTRTIINPDGSSSTFTSEYEAELENDLAAIRDIFPTPDFGQLHDLWSEACSEPRAVVAYVKAQLLAAPATAGMVEDAKDAARYRWLRDDCPDLEAMNSAWLYEEFDRVIDAAINATLAAQQAQVSAKGDQA